MNISQAANSFIQAHKPDRIDVDHLKRTHGSVEQYLRDNRGDLGDGGECYIEISKFDTVDGATKTIEWYEDVYLITHYNLPFELRVSQRDWMPETEIEPDLYSAIMKASSLQKSSHEIRVTLWEGGEPIEDVDWNSELKNLEERMSDY